MGDVWPRSSVPAAAACGMLRQMAGKDEVKAEFVGSQGLQLLERVLGLNTTVSVVIEFLGGLMFLVLILRRGRR